MGAVFFISLNQLRPLCFALPLRECAPEDIDYVRRYSPWRFPYSDLDIWYTVYMSCVCCFLLGYYKQIEFMCA